MSVQLSSCPTSYVCKTIKLYMYVCINVLQLLYSYKSIYMYLQLNCRTANFVCTPFHQCLYSWLIVKQTCFCYNWTVVKQARFVYNWACMSVLNNFTINKNVQICLRNIAVIKQTMFVKLCRNICTNVHPCTDRVFTTV